MAALAALTAAGCAKRKPAEAPAAAGAAAPKTSLQQRMEDPDYLETLKAFQAERESKAAEAAQIRVQLAEMARKAEKEDAAAIALRGEIRVLQEQIAEKEKALSEIARRNPEWIKLEESYRAVEAELDAIRQRAQTAVQQKMLEQAAARKAAVGQQAAAGAPRPPRAPAVRKAPAQPSFAPVVVTNAGVRATPPAVPAPAAEEKP